MAKNIVVLSDGTGQEGGRGHNSNVYKLFNMLEDRTDKQVSFYDRGLGTGWRKLTGSVAGMGISQNIRECYEFIFDNYNSGAQVYLFGFSRGAATVRSLSSFIHLFGILPKSRPELIGQAYKIYKRGDRVERDRLADEFVGRHHTMWCRIKFLGTWDTVAALGIPLKTLNVFVNEIPCCRHKFQDLRLSESVEHARHALAIDDERRTFRPTLWDQPLFEGQTMKQVWFCGMHSDVGGGYAQQQLSDIPLIWMCTEAAAHGLRFYPEHSVFLRPNPSGTMHDSRGSLLAKFYRKRARSWSTRRHGKPVIHESALLRHQSRQDPPYDPWILAMDYDVDPWPKNQREHGRFLPPRPPRPRRRRSR